MNETMIGRSVQAIVIQTCEASEDGVCCQSDATRTYPTSQGIERHLCDAHFYELLRLIYAWHLIRRETLEAEDRCRASSDAGGAA